MYQILSGFFKTGMFKKTSTPLSKSTSGLANVTQQISRSAKSLIFIFLIFAGFQGKAATYYLVTTSAAQTPGSWNTIAAGGGTAATNFTTSGDIFIISSGQTAVFTNTIFGSGVTLQIDGTGVISLGSNITLTINGNIYFNGTSAN